MGVHWVDPMTPELNGGPFTQTFIYGSYDGKSAFLEPMMTLEYLQSRPKLNKSVWPPRAYDRDGYFPTRYSVGFDEATHEYTIALDNLVMRKAGAQLLEIQEIAEGDGPVVKPGDTVEMHYTGSFPDGKKFDSSLDRNETFTIKAGTGQVIKGFDMGVLGMKKGGKRKVTIPSELGYGTRGAGDVIPPNATLVFEIEIVSIK
jgi:FKBP-type peptidyl-prolyl cis-trans isomerase FkpA